MLWNSYCVHWFSFVLHAWPSFRKLLFTKEFWVILIGADFALKREFIFFFSVMRGRCTFKTRRPGVASMGIFDQGQWWGERYFCIFISISCYLDDQPLWARTLPLPRACTNAKWKCSNSQSFANDSHLFTYLSNTGQDTCLSLLQNPLDWLENMNDCGETTEPVYVCAQSLTASFFKLKLWAVTSCASNVI